MSGGRRVHQVVVLVALVLGVLTMHSLVSPSAEHDRAGVVAAVSPDHMLTHADAAVVSPEHATMALHDELDGNSTPGPTPPHPNPGSPTGGHDLMHMCLAILVGMAALALAAWMVAVAVRRTADPSGCSPVDDRPARPPPRTAVRLAQLCVLRT